ncbi:MAG: tetratricopeptide repeat protein [Burkholderiales bacterium]|nr:tetratricopeptide repeat protein [Burkholderiales bacterium]
MAFDVQHHIDEYWFSGRWDELEVRCRTHLERAPGDADAAFVLAETCHSTGRRDEAIALLRQLADAEHDARYPARLSWLLQEAGDLDGGIAEFRRALALDPDCALARPHVDALLEVRDRIDDALGRQFAARAPAGALMLIHPGGAGFWSDVHHVLGHALAARIDGRRPYVHWGETSFFSEDPARNAWTDYFEPLDTVASEEIEAAAVRRAYPDTWGGSSPFRDVAARRAATGPISAADLVARVEPLVVGSYFTGVHLTRHLLPMDDPLAQADTGTLLRTLAPGWLRPRPHLRDRATSFVAEHFGDAPFIATHLRGTDKREEQGEHLEAVNRAIGRIVERLLAERGDVRLLLLTDDRDIEARYRSRYGNRIVTSGALRAQGSQSLHLGSGLPPRQLGEEVVVDVLTALAADCFVGNRYSNVACIVRALKPWPADRLYMLGSDDAVFNYWASVLQPCV